MQTQRYASINDFEEYKVSRNAVEGIREFRGRKCHFHESRNGSWPHKSDGVENGLH
jgi:hypothetical protein